MVDRQNDLTAAGVERSLRALRPKPTSIDRDRLMFLAGQRSVSVPRRRSEWGWRVATIVSTTAALLLAMLLINGDFDAPVARDVARPRRTGEGQEPATPSEVRPVEEAVLVRGEAEFGETELRADAELRQTISERGRMMLALRHAVSEAGASALSDVRASGNANSAPSVWDEVKVANLRAAKTRRNPRKSAHSKGLLGVFELGTKS